MLLTNEVAYAPCVLTYRSRAHVLTCLLTCSPTHLLTDYLTPPRTTGAGAHTQEGASRRSAPSSDEEAWWRRGGGPLRAKGPSPFDEARWAHRSRRGEAGRAVARWRGAWRGARRGARGGPSSLEGGPWCVSVVCECCVCRVCKLHSIKGKQAFAGLQPPSARATGPAACNSQ